MRILIVGAGVGGMTLAALLAQRGMKPLLIERAANFDHAGYMLGLWPLGYRVLHGLGLYERFAAESIEGNQYEVRDNRGGLIKHWAMEPISRQFGPNLSCTRPQLIKLLQEGLGDARVRFNTSIEAIRQQESEVEATFSDGTSGTFDLVVGADGMHSRVRELVFGTQPTFDTGWGGWVWWANLDTIAPETFVEHWGTGRFFGAYPTRGGVGVVAAAPVDSQFNRSTSQRSQLVRERFEGMGELVDTWLRAMPDDHDEMFFWHLADVRSRRWTDRRVVLLGDAAAGFLPTAGIGASMAMESAAVLADELSRTNLPFLEQALALYAKRRRTRVERIQTDSRRLARLMFIKSATAASVRNWATRFYSLEQLAGSMAKAFGEPI